VIDTKLIISVEVMYLEMVEDSSLVAYYAIPTGK
jgi:hypothetical protein